MEQVVRYQLQEKAWTAHTYEINQDQIPISIKNKRKSLWIFVPSNTCQALNYSYISKFLNFEHYGGMKSSVELGRNDWMDIQITDKRKKVSKRHVILKEKQEKIYLTAVGTCPTYISTFKDEPIKLENKKEITLENGAIVDLVKPNYSRFYLFNIYAFIPNDTAQAAESQFAIGKRGNVYSLNVEDEVYHFNTGTCTPTVLAETILNAIDGLPITLCFLIIELSCGDVMHEENLVMQHISYTIGKNARRRRSVVGLSGVNLFQPCDQPM
eukprot:130012_1